MEQKLEVWNILTTKPTNTYTLTPIQTGCICDRRGVSGEQTFLTPPVDVVKDYKGLLQGMGSSIHLNTNTNTTITNPPANHVQFHPLYFIREASSSNGRLKAAADVKAETRCMYSQYYQGPSPRIFLLFSCSKYRISICQKTQKMSYTSLHTLALLSLSSRDRLFSA